MPYTIKRKKLKSKVCFSVVGSKSRRVFSKCTTLTKAKKQIRLLRAIEMNPKFVPRGTMKNRSMSKSK